MSDHHQEHVRPLIGLRTPLGIIPREWLSTVEPRLARPAGSSCWFWEGNVNNDGEPVVTRLNLHTQTRQPLMVKQIVLDLFWDEPDYGWDVVHGCGNKNCLNPRHFYVSNVKWNQEDRPAVIKRWSTRISRWAKDRQ